MAWIESHQDIREHPKTYALMEKLQLDKRGAVGLVHLLWWWAMDNALTGEIRQPNVAVARAVGWEGDANTLVEALVECGWLERKEGALHIHDWHHRAGAIVEKRLQRKALKESEADAKRRPNGRRKSAERLTNGAENRPTVSVSVSESVPKTKDIAATSAAVTLPTTKEMSPIQRVVRAWKIQSGNDPEDAAWDKVHFTANCGHAKRLLELFGGEADAAIDCIEDRWGQIVGKQGLTLSLAGVVKNSDVFRQRWLERKELQATGAR